MRRSLPLLVLALLVGLLLSTGPAAAHDCSSPADCQETANYNVAVAMAGGAIAVISGLYGAMLGGALPGSIAGLTGGGGGAGGVVAAESSSGPDDDAGSGADDIAPAVGSGLVDPWTGEELLVNDGGYQHGEPGMVWYGGDHGDHGWVTREEAQDLLAEDREAVLDRERQRETFIAESRRISDEAIEGMVARAREEAAAEAAERARRENAFSDYQTVHCIADRNGWTDLLERAEGEAFHPDGTIDADYMERLTEVARNRLGRDIAAPDEELDRGWVGDFVSETTGEVMESTTIRIGMGVLTSGSSEVVYQSYAAAQAMQAAEAQAAARGDTYTFTDALRTGASTLADENLPTNTVRTLQDENATWADVGLSVGMDAFQALDVLETGRNIRGSVGTAARGGSVREVLTHREAGNVFESIRRSGPEVEFPGRVPEVEGRFGADGGHPGVEARGASDIDIDRLPSDYPPPGNVPTNVPRDWGMPRNNAIEMQRIAEDELVDIRVRPSNKWTAQRLAEGAGPKPATVKIKSINEIDTKYLGAPENSEGLVGMWELPETRPVRPPDVSKAEWRRVEQRWFARRTEFATDQQKIQDLIDFEGYIRDPDGLLRTPNGRKITGDHDLYDIRNHDGRPLEEVVGKDEAWRIKERVVNRLMGGPAEVQHGAHRDWPEMVQRTEGRALTEREQGIFDHIVGRHAPGGEGLQDFGPGRAVRVSYETPSGAGGGT